MRKDVGRWVPHLAWVALVSLLLQTPGVVAFGSVPAGSSEHDTITEAAATPLGFNGKSLQALQEAERRPDLREVKVQGVGSTLIVLDAGGDYEPAHHCDRVPPTTSETSFAQATAFIRFERDQALLFARGNHSERAVWWLGYALHAIQDCYSHSDISERNATAQAQYLQALMTGGNLPPFVRLCGFQPGADDVERPPGDPYPHGEFNKDAENLTTDAAAFLPNGRTKFVAARELATFASHEFLRRFMENLTDKEKAALFEVTPTTSPSHLGPASAMPAAVAVVAATIVARMLRRR